MALFGEVDSQPNMQRLAYVQNNLLDIAIVAGEASGDWIAALAIESLIAEQVHLGVPLMLEGITGPRLNECGVLPLESIHSLSVRGYLEVIRHLPRLLRLQRQLIRRWTFDNPPRVFLGVDAPDFNLKIELALKQKGIPTIHLVCPSIWAWRMQRIHLLKKACDHVLCLFPFEPKILSQAKIESTYIGHPMAQRIPQQVNMLAYRHDLGFDSDVELLAVLPGSRLSELVHLTQPFIQTCIALKKIKPHLEFITPLPNQTLLNYFLQQLPNSLRASWKVQIGQSHESMAAANAVLLASGTATLEAMMFKKPMVIAYKMPSFSYYWMKQHATDLPYVGLPNILLKEFVVPECLQSQVNPDHLKRQILFQLDSDSNRTRIEALFAEQHALLSQPSNQLAAQIIRRYL